MPLTDFKGGTACVLGAGEGLGAAFSYELARRGFHLLLADKNKDTLESTGKEISHRFHTGVSLLQVDLADPSSVSILRSAFMENNVTFLVYNAAYGPVRPFLENTEVQLEQYIRVNMGTTLHLAHAFVEINRERKAGILLLSSLAGFRGTRYVVPYAATKAFCWNLAEGLHYEFINTKMQFSVCVAGATATPGYLSTKPRNNWMRPKAMEPGKVAKEALDKFGKKLFIVPGILNKVTHFIFNHLLPRSLASSVHNRAMSKMYGP